MVRKCKIISILALLTVMSPCFSSPVYAEDDKYKPTDVSMEDYKNPVTPGFNNEIDEAKKYYSTFTSAFNQNEEKKDDKKDDSSSSSSDKDDKDNTYVYYQKPAELKANYTIVSTCPNTGNKGDFWGKTSDNKWVCIIGGVPAVGWKQFNGVYYYMDYDGFMLTGWQNIGPKWYYLYPSGAMAHDTWIGNYYVGHDGAMR